MRYTFLHAADLHLGAAPEATCKNAPAHVAAAIRGAAQAAYARLIAFAIQERVAFVLFAGDMAHTSSGNLGARLQFRDGLRQLHDAGIASFVIHGNHDPIFGPADLQLPQSCHTFGSTAAEPMVARADGRPVARVYGVSYGSQRVRENLARDYPRTLAGEDGLLQIAMLHGNQSNAPDADRHENYAPFTTDDLRERGYDYWALGHVHTYREVCRGTPWAVYPGALQGANVREIGRKGAVKVECDGPNVESVRFIPMDALRWGELAVDISQCEHVDQAIERSAAACEEYVREGDDLPHVFRLRLSGETTLHSTFESSADRRAFADALGETLARLESFAHIEQLYFETSPTVDWARISEQRDTVPGWLLNLSQSESDELSRTARAALAELIDHPGVRKCGFELNDAELRRMIRECGRQAVSMVLREEQE